MIIVIPWKPVISDLRQWDHYIYITASYREGVPVHAIKIFKNQQGILRNP